jgi:TonB family protein
MSRSDYEKYPAILAHELQHIRCRHSLDVLLMTAVSALHWFNPLVWIARAELKLLHEYEADESLIRQGIDVTSYQLLLVRKAVGEQRFSLANGFNHAKLKQRITMMQHKPTSGWMRLAYVALLPFLAGTMFLCNPARAEIRPATPGETAVIQDDDPPVPYSQIEKKPTFQGEDASTFGRWVAQHLNYPEKAKADGLQGRVMVGFEISKDGSVRNVRVLRGVHETLDAEAVRVISSSPKWEPGEQGGKPVKVSYTFPVIFKMNGDEPSTVPTTITIRKAAGAEGDPIIYLDGEKFSGNISDIDVSTVQSMEVLKDAAAIEKYGEEAKNGVILIKTKK